MTNQFTAEGTNALGSRISTRVQWRRVAGFLLLGLGFIVAPISTLFFAILILFLGFGPMDVSLVTVLPLLGMFFSPIIIIWGWLLAAGRKQLILFLRRFGSEALNDAVRDLVQTRLRRHFRLVTLDDSVFPPAGPRWSGLLVSLSPAAFILLGIVITFGGFAKLTQSELEFETPFGGPLTLIQFGIVALGALAFIVCVVLTIVAIRAHFLARRTIDSSDARNRVIRKIRRLKHFVRAPSIAAPLATVITTTDAEWQPTINDIAPLCKVVLLDLSRPSESICWELETILSLGLSVIVLIHRDQFHHWRNTNVLNTTMGLWNRLVSLAAGLPLVVYETPARIAETSLTDIIHELST